MTETTAAKRAQGQKPADPAGPDPRDDEIARLRAEIEQMRTSADATPPAAAEAEEPVSLSLKAVLAAINDGADDPETVDALNRVLYRFGAQDPSMQLPRSWQRVQRRIGVDPEKLDGFATAEQVGMFANRAGLTITK